jgi:hypothetical protein
MLLFLVLARTLTVLSEIFVFFLYPSRLMLGQYIKVVGSCFLPHPLQFIIHYLQIRKPVLLLLELTELITVPQHHCWGLYE